MSLSANYPALAPNLLLDFSNSAVVDPRVTVTRASTATYYNGLTYAKAEENLLLQSQALTTSPWVTTNLSAVGSKTAPDGTATAIEITATGTNGRTRQTVTVVSGQTYTHSMFVRRVTGSGTVTLAILDSGGTALFSTVMSLTSDWQRFTVSGAPAVTSIQAGIIIATSTDAVEVWGAQLEQRSSVTAYTATTTQPITNYIQALQTAQNNVPRIDHNPVTNATLGLLIEEQRTNLLTYSEDFANAAWTKLRASITANATVAPDGTLTGDKLVEDTTVNSTHFVFRNVTGISSSTAHTISVFAKADERTRVVIGSFDGATGIDSVFNLVTGVVDVQGAGSTCSMSSVGNGWYRCIYARTTGVSSTALEISFRLDNASSGPISATYTGNGYSGVFLWGAQLEVGAFPTSYIPTTTTALTRNADALSLTGTNFSSWYSAGEGTLLARCSLPANPAIIPAAGSFPRIASINDDTDNNTIEMFLDGSSPFPVRSRVRSGAVNQAIGNGATSLSLNTQFLSALTYKVNDFAAADRGLLSWTDTSGTIPTVNRLGIGNQPNGILFLNGHIQRIAYYPLRNTNAQLQALTG